MATDRDLSALLADLKRQRAEIDKRIADVEGRRESAADLVERFRMLRERAERTTAARVDPNEETMRIRRS